MAEHTFEDAIRQTVAELKQQFADYKKDGLKTREVVRFVMQCVGVLAIVSLAYSAVPKAKRKQQVVGAVRSLYTELNPDIPWVPEPFETMVESMMLDYVVPELYDALT